jgi:hypothetical protein
MNALSHLWYYLAVFFLEWEMFKNINKIETHILCSITFFPESRFVYEIMSKNMVEPDVTIWRKRVACWISKATCTHAHAHAHTPGHPHKHPPHLRTHTCAHRKICHTYCFSSAAVDRERASVLRCTYIACLFNIVFAVMNEMIKL